jgi:hypothetical protein
MKTNGKNIKLGTYTQDDYIKANRRGRREELENSIGFVTVHKVHASKKTYNRKKYKGPEID